MFANVQTPSQTVAIDYSFLKDNNVRNAFLKQQKNNLSFDYKTLEGFTLDRGEVLTLEGFEQLKSLKALSLRGNFIQEISNLGQLKKLITLNLSGNEIKTATPLVGLENLEFLNLSHNQISFAFGCSFKRLRRLDVSYNKIQQLFLEGNGNFLLEEINISNNPLSEIKGKSSLPALKTILCDATFIKDLSCLVKFTSLEVIKASNCPKLTDISALFFSKGNLLFCKLPNLKQLNISEEKLNSKSRDILAKIRAGKLNQPLVINGNSFFNPIQLVPGSRTAFVLLKAYRVYLP